MNGKLYTTVLCSESPICNQAIRISDTKCQENDQMSRSMTPHVLGYSLQAIDGCFASKILIFFLTCHSHSTAMVVPIYVFPEMKLCSLVIFKTELKRSVSQFLQSCMCERFIYYQDRSAYFAPANYVDRSWEHINCYPRLPQQPPLTSCLLVQF